MEEVWKEIKLTSLNDCSINAPSPTTNTTRSAFRNLILHEFLDGAFNKDASSACNNLDPTSAAESTFTASLNPTPLLSLSSISITHSDSDLQKQSHNSFLSSFNTSFDALNPSNKKKRAQPQIDGICDSSDRRHMRLVKNRESADRSRARKQAYRKELEIKVTRLREENSRLRKQIEKLQLCLASSGRHLKKRTLHRSLTSPF